MNNAWREEVVDGDRESLPRRPLRQRADATDAAQNDRRCDWSGRKNPVNESNSAKPPILILAGPTGAGKTQLAVWLAQRLPYELVSADSMQVYRGMEIGTAQPTEEELRGVPVHATGILEPDERFDVARFLEICDRAHADIEARGKTPLYVGGTGLYLRALRWGLFDQPEIPRKVRRELEEELEREGTEAMHARLAERDPELAGRISERDRIRIVRGLEVALATGRPLSDWQRQWERREPRFPHRLVILTCPREVLVARIERRTRAMLEAGWIEEVERLLERGYSPELHAFKALGYREIVDHLRGRLSRDELEEQIMIQTRRFAKRQMTWFRSETAAQWIEYDGEHIEQAGGRLINLLELQTFSS